ncbi:MAG: hypothetical protein KKF48_02960 [Nanoarchaeota archaeon]|nr:hypothetical protein [Nanoarchaeota archaeon]MBU1027983.1 hypothetical protein [Nanoarchaeota archaeon]
MNPLKLSITKIDVLSAIDKALKEKFIDNLRNRSKIVQLDSRIRGYLGEITLKRWFSDNGIIFSETNYINETGDMDIDFILKKDVNEWHIEVKTSLIPDSWGDLKSCIEKGDIKIIKRTELIEDLKGDFHIQIYFNKKTNERDNWLNGQKINWQNKTPTELYDLMNLNEYEEYFVSWIDRPSLILDIKDKIKNKKIATWKFGLREFWRCRISLIGKDPCKLIETLKELKNEK